MLDLDAIEARAEAATRGPWIGSSVPSGRKYGVISVKDYGEWTRSGARPLAVLSGIPTHGRHPDTQFIAARPHRHPGPRCRATCCQGSGGGGVPTCG